MMYRKGRLCALVLLFSAFQLILGGVFSLVKQKCDGLQSKLLDEYKFRKEGVDRYRDSIQHSAIHSVKSIARIQSSRLEGAVDEFKQFAAKYSEIQQQTSNRIRKKQLELAELNSRWKRRSVYESLQTLRSDSRRLKDHVQLNIGRVFKLPALKLRAIQNNFMVRVNDAIQNGVKVFSRPPSMRHNTTVDSLDSLFVEANLVRRALQDRIANLNNTIVQAFPTAKTNEDVRRVKQSIDAQIQRLEQEGTQWLEERRRQVDASLRAMQAKLLQKDVALEAEVKQKRTAIQYSEENERVLQQVLDMIEPNAKGWKLIRQEGTIRVYRKLPKHFAEGTAEAEAEDEHPPRRTVGEGRSGGGGGAGAKEESRYACVKCYGEVRATPDQVFDLLTDEARTKEFNSLYEKGSTIAVIDEDTKVVHSASITIFPFKPRDFVTVVHFRRLRDGTRLVLNRATEHELVPKKVPGYVRGTIVLAANIIQPIAGRPGWSKVTMITQVDPGGFAPAGIMNQVCTLGPVGFIKNVEVAANKPSYHSKAPR